MKLTQLKVSNYKSLREICLVPSDLTVVVGANASGKSNLADFHDFLADLYRHGLSVAVARKGGYENIAHRKMRRSRRAISIGISVEIDRSKIKNWPIIYQRGVPELRFSHSFSFKAEGQTIRSDFRVDSEYICLERKTKKGWKLLAEIERTKDGSVSSRAGRVQTSDSDGNTGRVLRQFQFLKNLEEYVGSESMAPTELLLSSIGRFIPILRLISDSLAAVRVFQLSPTNTRQFGVPIPNPEMDRFGGNLPAVVDMIAQRHPRVWEQILDVMRQLLPGLERIEVDYTHSRTLGLYFHESGVGRPWTVAEISDGTIHSLALLVALHDPRTNLLVLEEPENSVHTWILRLLMESASSACQSKQIIITTHSRVVVDAVSPTNVWVMWRTSGESKLAPLTALDDDILELVENGDLTTFEVLDTGLVVEVLPPAPESN